VQQVFDNKVDILVKLEGMVIPIMQCSMDLHDLAYQDMACMFPWSQHLVHHQACSEVLDTSE